MGTMQFFTSDEHHGHFNIIALCKRPFTDITHQTKELIARHNAVVGRMDDVYHLGDMYWRTFGIVPAMDVMNVLHGRHYYVRGNHEEMFERWGELRSRYLWTKDLAELKLDGYPRLVLCHYALRAWHGQEKGAWHLFGHSHGQLPDEASLSMDVGVDASGLDYAPISIQQVSWKMHQKMDWIQYATRKKPARDLLEGNYW